MIENKQPPFYDIYGTWHIPFWHQAWYIKGKWFFIVLCFITFTTFFIYRMYSYFQGIKKRKLYSALDACVEIKQKIPLKNLPQEKVKAIYKDLIGIFKRYFAVLLKKDFSSYTDEEFEKYLLSDKIFERLGGMLDIKGAVQKVVFWSRMVKFSNVKRAREEIVSDCNLSIEIIETIALCCQKH